MNMKGASTRSVDSLLQLGYATIMFVCLVELLSVEVYADWARYMLFIAPVVITAGFWYVRRRTRPQPSRTAYPLTGLMRVTLVVYAIVAVLNQFPLLDWSTVHF